jgi:hypothetical protein
MVLASTDAVEAPNATNARIAKLISLRISAPP